MIDKRQKNAKDSRIARQKSKSSRKRNEKKRSNLHVQFVHEAQDYWIRDRRSRVTRTNEEEDLGGWRHLLLCRLAQIGRGRSLCTLITLMPVLNTLLLDRIRRAYLPWQRPAVPVYPGTLLERACPLYLTILHFYLASMNKDHLEIQFLLHKTLLLSLLERKFFLGTIIQNYLRIFRDLHWHCLNFDRCIIIFLKRYCFKCFEYLKKKWINSYDIFLLLLQLYICKIKNKLTKASFEGTLSNGGKRFIKRCFLYLNREIMTEDRYIINFSQRL